MSFSKFGGRKKTQKKIKLGFNITLSAAIDLLYNIPSSI